MVHNVVQEVVSGASVFEWDSQNVPSLYGDSVTGNGFTAGTTSDYLHPNSMCIDPRDGNFVFSFRNMLRREGRPAYGADPLDRRR